jgi:hypothetical protein
MQKFIGHLIVLVACKNDIWHPLTEVLEPVRLKS